MIYTEKSEKQGNPAWQSCMICVSGGLDGAFVNKMRQFLADG